MTTRRVPVLLAVVVAVVSATAMISQRPARLVADGTEYHAMAMQYAAGERVVVAEAPFVTRIATPWLASRLDPLARGVLPGRVEHAIEEANGLKGFPGFYAVNILASLAATALLYVYVCRFVQRPHIRLALISLWVIQWLGPVRFTYFYPAYVDPLFVACLFGALVAIEYVPHLATAALLTTGIAFAGMFARESAVLIPVLFVVRHWRSVLRPAGRYDRVLPLLPLLAVPPAALLIQRLTTPEHAYDMFAGPLAMLRDKPFFTWVLAWFFTFGPAAIALIVAGWDSAGRVLRAHPYMAVHLAACGVLGYVGGTDTERILAWTWPVVLVLLAAAWQQNGAALAGAPLLSMALVLVALVSARIFWTVPAGIDDETPLTALRFDVDSLVVLLDKLLVMHNYYANLWSFFGSRALHAAQLAFDLTLTAVFALCIRRRSALS